MVFNVTNKFISFSSAAIVNGTAYFGTSDGWLHALNSNTGEPIADFQTDGSKQNSARYSDKNGRVQQSALYSDFTLDGMFAGMDRMYSLGSILSSPVVADGTLYVGSTDGNLYALQ